MRLLLLPLLLIINLTFSAQVEKVDVLPISSIRKKPVKLIVKGNFTFAYYTTNGAIPTKKDKKLDTSLIITKTTALLIKVVGGGKDTLIARSYIFDTLSTLPVLSITIPQEDLWDSIKGVYTKGSRAVFNDSTGFWENCNFQQNWEKEIQLIYIDSSRSEVINQACGLRIFGESTRRQPDKSLKIVARKNYGQKRFNYPFFDQKPAILAYKHLVVRTSGNDYNNTRFKDVLNAYLIRNLELDHMAYQPIRMYVNGEYWGVYNLREKINKHYLYYNHGVSKKSSSIIMGRWVTQHGKGTRYKEMYDWFFNLETMDSLAYLKANAFLDIRNYINYRAFQLFINNTDSRGNVRYWNSTELDNKFRMIVYDTDLGYGSISKDYLAKSLSPIQTDWFNNTWSTIYFRKLMEYPAFKQEFINQYAHLMNTALHTDTIIEAVNKFEALYKDELPRTKAELPAHFKNVPIPLEKWLKNVEGFRFFAKKRPEIAREEITKSLSKEGTFYLKIEGKHAQVRINKNYALKVPFEGIYFKNVPLPILVLPDSGYLFKSWENGSFNADTLLVANSDTIILRINCENSPKPPVIEEKTVAKEPVKTTLEFNDILWLIAWGCIGLGTILLLLYLKRRK